jgi:hypothetical protein
MKKLRTVEDLYDFLSAELAWRRIELASIRSLVATRSGSESRKNAILRCGITILYAHWEGFCKAAGMAYLNFVAFQNLTYQELKNNFIALGMKKLVNDGIYSDLIENRISLVNFVRDELHTKSSLPYKDGVDTKSNLSSSVLKEIVLTLGLDYSPFEGKEKLIDEKLLKNRNAIAHGNYLLIDEDEFDAIYHQVLAMMNELRNQIDNSANTNAFKV